GQGLDGFAGRVGVDVVPAGAPLAVALDAPAEEVEALADVGDLRLLRRQAQAHRGQDRRRVLAHLLGVLAGAGDHEQPVVRIADQPVVALAPASPDGPLALGVARAAGDLGDRLVQHPRGQVGQHGGDHAPNAVGNFCFEVTLGYRRVERGRGWAGGGRGGRGGGGRGGGGAGGGAGRRWGARRGGGGGGGRGRGGGGRRER